MKSFWLLILFQLFICSAQALPADVEFDRLSLELERAEGSNDYPAAEAALNKIKELNYKLPQSFYIRLGKSQKSQEKFGAASKSYEAYINQYGRQGKFYREALELFNETSAEFKKRQTEYSETSQRRTQALKDLDEKKVSGRREYQEKIESCTLRKRENCGSRCDNHPNAQSRSFCRGLTFQQCNDKNRACYEEYCYTNMDQESRISIFMGECKSEMKYTEPVYTGPADPKAPE
jgi:hypothetical protein